MTPAAIAGPTASNLVDEWVACGGTLMGPEGPLKRRICFHLQHVARLDELKEAPRKTAEGVYDPIVAKQAEGSTPGGPSPGLDGDARAKFLDTAVEQFQRAADRHDPGVPPDPDPVRRGRHPRPPSIEPAPIGGETRGR